MVEDGLHRLVYYSRNAIGGDGAELDGEIRQILASSRRNNPADGVTGALMFNRGCFAQVLEGGRRDVERVFERIQRDLRHGDVVALQFGPVPERGFPAWSMAFVGGSEEDGARYGGIAGESGFDPEALGGDRLFGILRDLVVEEGRAAAP